MDIVIAILAKNKAHCLSLYLKCLYNQTYDKKKIHLYIKTNDNTDNTEEILSDFANQHKNEYASIFFDKQNISEDLKKYGSHEWNTTRFKILAKIRQNSINHAIKLNAHYFVVDCDNYIIPSTLSNLYDLKELGVVSPMLESKNAYSNYHYEIDNNGYYKQHELYWKIRNREFKGIIELKVVHCTYFIHNKILKDVNYDDNSNRYEYVIFSDCLRKRNIGQYLDNRIFYGFLDFAETKEEFIKELPNFKQYEKFFLNSFLSKN